MTSGRGVVAALHATLVHPGFLVFFSQGPGETTRTSRAAWVRDDDSQPVRLAGGWWMVLICSEKKSTADWLLMAGLL
jgi:hypothetical protein